MTRFNPKHIFLIGGLVFLTYGQTLTHEFTGDAQALFGRNTFYKDPRNLSRLFQKDFIWTSAGKDEFVQDAPSFSGCISYRPVTALSFFVDQFLWRGCAFGFHLTNVLLHLSNALLLYALVVGLGRPPATALLASLLFSVHPVQSEAVSSVGYRSDLLLAFLGLLSVLFFLKKESTPCRKKLSEFGCCAFLLLALFSKETAVTLPVLFVVLKFFGLAGAGSDARQKGRPRITIDIPALAVAVFYLWVYLRVFPSAHYPRWGGLGIQGLAQLKLAVTTLSFYLTSLAWPSKVVVLPTLYAPSLEGGIVPPALVLAMGAGLTALVLRFRKKSPAASLGVVWFWLTLFPASNIVPLPNPLAYRFLYLPSAGLAVSAAVALTSLLDRLRGKMTLSPHLLLSFPIVGLLAALTIPLNSHFRTTRAACREMVRNFPDSSRPYWVLALGYFDEGRFAQAEHFFQRYLQAQEHNPFVPDPRADPVLYHYLGLCRRADPEAAAPLFQKALELDPRFLPARLRLTQCLIRSKQYERSLALARSAIASNPNLAIAHIYAAHSCAELGRFDQAQRFLERAGQIAPDDDSLKYAEQFLKEKRGL